MKKRLITVILATPLIVTGVALAKQDTPKEDKKITICHATSAEKNPWVRIVVSENAYKAHFENPGTPLAGHEDDVLLQGDKPCPEPKVIITPIPPTPAPQPTPSPTPTPTPQPSPAPQAPVTTPTATVEDFPEVQGK